MTKKIKRCTKKCLKHTFSLNPVHYSAVFSRELQANFCIKLGENHSITPKFNNDKRYFTASFYLPVDSQKLSKNEEFYRNEHQKYKLDHTSEKSKIFQAKPKSKYNYCNVCKFDHEDYLEHIGSTEHKKRVNQNTFSLYIRQLCEQINSQALTTQQNLQQEKKFEEKEKRFQTNLPSLSYLSQNTEVNKEINLNQSPQFRKRVAVSKSFHAFSQYNEQKIMFPADQPDFVMPNPLYSPIKRYSEITEGIRLVSNIRPIILFESQHDLNF